MSTSPLYSHSQSASAWPLIGIFGSLAAVGALLLFIGERAPALVVLLMVGILIFSIAVMFSSLTAEVTEDEVVVFFGSGWPKKTIVRSDINAVISVRNSWWMGWGIRWLNGGTVWNVSGLDAVELALRNGKRFRIGTDEPEALRNALSTHL